MGKKWQRKKLIDQADCTPAEWKLCVYLSSFYCWTDIEYLISLPHLMSTQFWLKKPATIIKLFDVHDVVKF